MPTELDRLAAEKYVVLTTFRRDGRAVPTPVWFARDGEELVVSSERKAGKVKRIRNSARVQLQPSNFRGRTHGPTATGTARLLDDAASERIRTAIARQYGLVGRVTMFFSRLRGGPQRTIGIAIRLEEKAAG
ncbi:PPOX class F420-dependent oxidoreductase [Amycolatopsis sp. FDAARGOS 1241]|uniref:PPOX class F420-dependent oxidoreductase n=1 Tax=Amycolatopsis sp. FDAARGOS 1241 TaxID=2778070 RepID=UPI00194DFF11|nr:PPOX class F420-dependent oxidoreductase [Amycolatopsis sp. FDAARGOS 1241]QRP44166.1 PPOX class F420-dependent oxidoreductase [Amycolatopsis sp. FDAARGOS 1241]